MSGSNDKLAYMPPGTDPVSRREPDPVGPRQPDPVGPREPDPVGPRESDPIRAEFQERMERLPPGHPSSPYNDDGSRKPPLPDLSDYELPIPGDPDYRPEPSRASEADRPETGQASEHVTPGTKPDEGPERTADRAELWEVPPDGEPPTDAAYTEHVQEVRERPDQSWAWGLAPDVEDIPDVRGEVSHEEREAFHDAPADDLDERTASELPLPGDPDYQPEPSRASEAEGPTDERSASAGDRQHADDKTAADEQAAPDSETARPSDSEDRPRSGPDGSWEWKTCALTPDQSELADQGLEGCREVEGRDQSGSYGKRGLTPAMRGIEAQLDHSELAPDTEKFALKSADRLKEKFAKLIQRHPGENPEKLLNQIHDAIRYTFLSDTADYVTGVWEATDNLQSQGYELIVRINNWGDAEYKGVNTRWRDHESGLLFEVQFHTPESRDAKQQTHEAYEKINDVRTPVAEVERLRQYQQEVSAQIPMPPGWQSIPGYRKENK
jgi:hypothetical protein